MQRPETLVLIGGLVSLISSLASIAVQHLLSLRRQKHQTRNYPREVVFNKQTKFYEEVVHILPGINGYITMIDVWLGETSPEAKRRIQEEKEKTGPIWTFHELMEAFSMYLPAEILQAGERLIEECYSLSRSPAMERAERCINLLFSFQNTIRECIGVDSISEELFKAFGTHRSEKPTASE